LSGGDLPLSVVRAIYPTAQAFRSGVLGLLSSGDVELVDNAESAIPHVALGKRIEQFRDFAAEHFAPKEHDSRYTKNP
jgi:hypothetical protein